MKAITLQIIVAQDKHQLLKEEDETVEHYETARAAVIKELENAGVDLTKTYDLIKIDRGAAPADAIITA